MPWICCKFANDADPHSHNPLICRALLPSTTRRFPAAWRRPTPRPSPSRNDGPGSRNSTEDARPLWVCCDAEDASVQGWLSVRSFYGRPAYHATVEIGVYVAPSAQREGHRAATAGARARARAGTGSRGRCSHSCSATTRRRSRSSRSRVLRMGNATPRRGAGWRRARSRDPRTACRMSTQTVPSRGHSSEHRTVHRRLRDAGATCRICMRMIRALADYERLAHLVVADESRLRSALFGERPVAEALIAREGAESRAAAGFALFFHTFSTFLGQRGPVAGGSVRRARAPRTRDRAPVADGTGGAGPRARLRALRMGGPRLERAGHRFLRADGRDAAARLADRARHRRGACASSGETTPPDASGPALRAGR